MADPLPTSTTTTTPVPVETAKPGSKTTEFLLAGITSLVGLALIVFGMIKGNEEILQTGMTMLLGSSGIYGIARAIAKYGATPNTVTTTVITQQPPTPAPAPTTSDQATTVHDRIPEATIVTSTPTGSNP